MGNYLYVIAEPKTGFVKFGIANNPNGRLSSLQTGNPRKLELAYCEEMPTREMAEQAECRAHGICLKWRAEGEWFSYPTDLAIQEAKWACNFVRNFRARLPAHSNIHRLRDLGFDYKSFLAEELAAEAAGAMDEEEGDNGAHQNH